MQKTLTTQIYSQLATKIRLKSNKKHETLPANPSIHIFTNRINNRLVFKINDGYKIELQIPETMKFLAAKN